MIYSCVFFLSSRARELGATRESRWKSLGLLPGHAPFGADKWFYRRSQSDRPLGRGREMSTGFVRCRRGFVTFSHWGSETVRKRFGKMAHDITIQASGPAEKLGSRVISAYVRCSEQKTTTADVLNLVLRAPRHVEFSRQSLAIPRTLWFFFSPLLRGA